MRKQKIKFLSLYFILLFILFFTISIPTSFAGLFDSTPELITVLNSAFEKIEEWLLKLATPAAEDAIEVGVFMKKLSYGDEERIKIAKKLIRGSLFSYGFILAINLILSAIKSLIGS